ncbi:hypothetical protein RvY_15803 [Ramazzottius varieornatus]|uniref:Uncharacterized protein n=1 Tax=Ramazzottius varieornatus TaxID=947166 RepID=A0A1D1VZ93_RAMVA|nr:hypothetical protein RvY_15803 [Ramazzottius varieornatus]
MRNQSCKEKRNPFFWLNGEIVQLPNAVVNTPPGWISRSTRVHRLSRFRYYNSVLPRTRGWRTSWIIFLRNFPPSVFLAYTGVTGLRNLSARCTRSTRARDSRRFPSP